MTTSALQSKGQSEATKANNATAKHCIQYQYHSSNKLDPVDSRRRFSRRGSKTAAMLIRDAPCGYEKKDPVAIKPRDLAGKAVHESPPPNFHQELPTKDVFAQESILTTDHCFRELPVPTTVQFSSHRISSPDITTSLGNSLQGLAIGLPSSSEGGSHHEPQVAIEAAFLWRDPPCSSQICEKSEN